ncbi:TadG family pilus assembly protein [Celeribacter halophilus]|uniref:TadG family pilus assembly protein n=1 Tax=Celeribacter halophilus TaxID=576117 RepID=UPI0026E43BB2|nr:TadG family pilus assembly protein [Celeribacter halophilus]
MRIKQLLQRYNADDSGAVVIIVALFLTAAVGFMAVGIDLGSLYFRQKTLQTQADMAAVSAVLNLYDEAEDEEDEAPRVAATQTVLGNALSAAALTGLSYGRYDYDSAVLAEDRFTEGSLTDADVNAAKAELADSAPLFFAKSFLNADSTPLSASATAARFDFASFSLGSRLLSLDTGESVLDGLLGKTLGTSVDLDVLDYNALLDTQIDLLTFSDALGNRIGATAGDYENILTSDIDLADIAGAILDTGAVLDSTKVLTTILNTTASTALNASDLIGIDGDNIAVQLEDILGATHVNALDLLKASLDILNDGSIVTVSGISLGIDEVTSVVLHLVVGEREAHSGWITLGERAATIHTAQVRLKLDLELKPELLGSLGLGVSVLSLNVPLYVEVASATATLTDLNCEAQEQSDTIATFDTGFDTFEGVEGTHVVEMFIGKFDDDAFKDIKVPLNHADMDYADILDLRLSLDLGLISLPLIELVTLQMKSHAAVGASQNPSVEFLVSEVATEEVAGEPKTIQSGELLSTTLTSLLAPSSVHINSEALGIVNVLLKPLLTSVLNILPGELLGALLTPLDAVLDSLLNTLGIGIGQGDLTLDGVNCGKVVLVQ